MDAEQYNFAHESSDTTAGIRRKAAQRMRKALDFRNSPPTGKGMKPEILVLTPIYEPTLAELQREFTVHTLWTARDPHAFMKEVAGGVRAVVTTGIFGFTRFHVEALSELEIVACFGTPHGTVDLDAAKRRRVIVTNTPDFNTLHVADLALGLLISVMRRICECDRFTRAGRWLAGYPPVGSGLSGKTCGIVGLGRIGRAIAKRAEAFDMLVRYHGPHRKQDVTYEYCPDLESMARESDCLIVACRATPETRNLIGARILEALGPEGFLINVARGSIVDEAALIAALKDRRIAGAGLDVFSDEPRIPAELVTMEHVVILPHIGTATRDIREGRGAKLLANLRAHFSGKPVLNPIT
jgi:hydroxypyruvate reductase